MNQIKNRLPGSPLGLSHGRLPSRSLVFLALVISGLARSVALADPPANPGTTLTSEPAAGDLEGFLRQIANTDVDEETLYGLIDGLRNSTSSLAPSQAEAEMPSDGLTVVEPSGHEAEDLDSSSFPPGLLDAGVLDAAELEKFLTDSGLNETDRQEAMRVLQASLQGESAFKAGDAGAGPAVPGSQTGIRSVQVERPTNPKELVDDLKSRGTPERLIHPLVWFLREKIENKKRVDPSLFFKRLKSLGLNTRTLEWMNDGKIRIYAWKRTEDAEAQYAHISNSLYIPEDYLDMNHDPPQIKEDLDVSQINTVIHELDHAEKDLLDNHSEMYGKSFPEKLYAGITGLGKYGAGLAAGTLGLSATLGALKYFKNVPFSKAGAIILAGSVIAGIGWAVLSQFLGDDEPPRTDQQEAAKEGISEIASAIRSDPNQRHEILGHNVPLTESNPKAWEVTGYFMGDSVTDMMWDLQTIQLHNQRRLRDAKTSEEIDEILQNLEVPDRLEGKVYGSTEGNHDAYFRLQPVGFPYKDHPSTFNKIWKNSLGLDPPADPKELVQRINATGSEVFPELKQWLRTYGEQRRAALGSASPATVEVGDSGPSDSGVVLDSPVPGPSDDPNTDDVFFGSEH